MTFLLSLQQCPGNDTYESSRHIIDGKLQIANYDICSDMWACNVPPRFNRPSEYQRWRRLFLFRNLKAPAHSLMSANEAGSNGSIYVDMFPQPDCDEGCVKFWVQEQRTDTTFEWVGFFGHRQLLVVGDKGYAGDIWGHFLRGQTEINLTVFVPGTTPSAVENMARQIYDSKPASYWGP